ncbi:MAG: TonB-dependent receptor, partial [Proteobacteria bacterium]|nr:TonB-dependent receptor [Pseudomonadota bacterium]
VLRGSAAMLFGRGQAGGVINQVSKTPLLGDRGKITGSIGTDGYREITGDFNKQLGDNTALRLNLMKRDEGSIRENPVTGTEAGVRREGVGVSLVTGLYTDNEITLNHYYLKTADNPDYGVPFDSRTKRPSRLYAPEDFWGTNDTFDDSETNITSLVHQLRLSPKAELRTQLRYATYNRAYWAAAPSTSRAPTVDLTAAQSKTRRSETEDLTLQSDLTLRTELLGMKHELLAGVEYLKENAARWTLLNQGSAASARYTGGVLNRPAAGRYNGDTIAVYAQDTVEFVPDWKFTLGLRRDELDADYDFYNANTRTASSAALRYGETSVRTGLSWQPRADTHYYISFSDSFSPTADLYQLSGNAYPAERSNVTELGAKWLLLDGDLALRAALYRADKEWERNTDLESSAAILTRKRRTDGLELEVAGRITPDWEVFAGLALMDAEILQVAENRDASGVVTSADPRLKGQRPRNTPAATFNLWTTYALGYGWKVGGGVEAKTERYAYSPSTTNAGSLFVNGDFKPNTAPAYARWDAMLAYEQPKWVARLNVKNLFDKVYYDQVYDNGGFTVPGTRRTVILTGEYKF